MSQPAFRSGRTKPRQSVPTYRATSQSAQRAVIAIFFSVLLCVGIGSIMLWSDRLTLGGVPIPIVVDFLQDETARTAYFRGDGKKLHDRLQGMGIEEKMKDFYRPQIPDEVELDQHIHQLLYDRTGYVGVAYKVNAGVLVLKR